MMTKNTTPKLLILLAVLVGVFLVVKFTGNKGRSKSLKTDLVVLDTAAVTKVEIEDPQGTTVLTKNDQQWMVGEYKAVNTIVRSMLSTLTTIEPSRIASRSESKWKDFSVDSTGTRIKVYEGNAVVTDVVIGRFGVEGQRSFYTYVRLFDDVDTYVADNFMKMSINTQGVDYRNSNLLRLNKDSLVTVTFNYPDSALVLNKSGDSWYKGSVLSDSAATVQYLNGLSYVNSKNFSDSEVSGTPDLNVTFGFTDQPEVQISAYRRPEGWLIQSSENDDEVWVDETAFNKVFTSTSQF